MLAIPREETHAMFLLVAVIAITSPLLTNCSGQGQRSLIQLASHGVVADVAGGLEEELAGGLQASLASTLGLEKSLAGQAGDPNGEFSTKSDEASDLGVMVKQMMQGIDTATGQARANGTSAAMKTTVDSMMAKFETLAVQKFKKAFAHAQSGLATAAKALAAQNTKVVADLKGANANHQKLGACRAQEKSLLEAYEASAADGGWANKTAEKACQEKHDAQFHDWKVEKELASKHKCDLGEEACPKLEALKKHLDEHYAKANKMRDEYKAKSEACENTRDAAATAQGVVQKKSDAFASQKAKCDQMEFEAKKSMCAFGTALQQKCEQYTALTDLIVKVRDGKDTSYSEADRQSNWAKAMTLKCQLKSYTGNGGVDNSVKKLCESDVDYEKDIGVMDYQEASISAVVRPSPPNFACDEKSILFTGPQWSTGNESALYKTEDKYEPAVTLTPLGTGAFSFCQSNSTRASCRGFLCEDPWKPKAGAETVKCVLTECSPYECCEGGAAAPAAPAAK